MVRRSHSDQTQPQPLCFFARAIPPAEPGQAGPDKMAAPAASALSAWWGEGQLLCDSVGHRLGTKKYTGFS